MKNATKGWLVDTKRWIDGGRTGTTAAIGEGTGRGCSGRCSYLRACAREGRWNKGARVAWVLFEMRTLSKPASEKRPDERRKDTFR